jgi:hypothetical protein
MKNEGIINFTVIRVIREEWGGYKNSRMAVESSFGC